MVPSTGTMWSLGRVAVTAVLAVALAGGKHTTAGAAHTATAMGSQEGCADSLGVLCAMLAGRVQGAGPDGQPDLDRILVSAYRRIDQAMKDSVKVPHPHPTQATTFI